MSVCSAGNTRWRPETSLDDTDRFLLTALTFAARATVYPDAGGVATYATKAFGPAAGGVAGWL